MTINSQDRFGIIFTIALVGFIFIIIQLLQSTFQTSESIIIILVCGIILSIAGFFSYKKKTSRQTSAITNRSYMLFFIVGIGIGLLIRVGLDVAYGINYQKAEPVSIYYGLSLVFGGYVGFYFFTAMSMVVSIVQIPFIRAHLHGDSGWFPCIAGVAVGLGIMAFAELFLNGLPKLWFIFS